jgi:flagellin
MISNVSLWGALRDNLISLQSTENLIALHEQRLATGKAVNSALDNPQAFFSSQALSARAGDLSALLDSIGQGIQVIQAASNGVTALTTLLNQQLSIANSAHSALAGASTQATVTGNTNLGTGKLASTIAGINVGDNLVITVTNPSGGTNSINLKNAIAGGITANTTAADLVNSINGLNGGTPAISASLNSSGNLTLTAVNGGTLYVKFTTSAGTQVSEQGTADALGFSAAEKYNQNGLSGTGSEVSFTQIAGNTLSSVGLYTAANTLAQASSTLNNLRDVTFSTRYTSLAAADTTLNLSVGGVTSANLFGADPATTTIQNVIDNINQDAAIGSRISASFDPTTAEIVLTPLTAAATDVQFQLNNGAGNAAQTFALFGVTSNSTTNRANSQATEDVIFGAAAGDLANLQSQYNTGLGQISGLVSDSSYAGTNLLNGNSLTTYFDETRSTFLTTTGTTFTESGLGLSNASFQSAAAIGAAISQLQAALNAVQNFGSTLSVDLNVIQTRQTFTNSLINVLQTGSDNLTNADQDAESAALLALQTRESLGIEALSLASTSQQAVLKLFP